MTTAFAPISIILLTSCSPGGSQTMATGSDDHFSCAAIIGALDQLVATGQVPQEVVPAGTRLTVGMTHLNAWAISNNLREKDAFEKVKEERSRLIATLSPAEITARAKACIDRV
jgi:hypothetical protein